MPVEARAYPRPLPNPEWLGKLKEEILEPDLPIVDPHHHLWDHPGSRYLLDELSADVNSGTTWSSYKPPPGLMDDPSLRRGLKRLPAAVLPAWEQA